MRIQQCQTRNHFHPNNTPRFRLLTGSVICNEPYGTNFPNQQEQRTGDGAASAACTRTTIITHAHKAHSAAIATSSSDFRLQIRSEILARSDKAYFVIKEKYSVYRLIAAHQIHAHYYYYSHKFMAQTYSRHARQRVSTVMHKLMHRKI